MFIQEKFILFMPFFKVIDKEFIQKSDLNLRTMLQVLTTLLTFIVLTTVSKTQTSFERLNIFGYVNNFPLIYNLKSRETI